MWGKVDAMNALSEHWHLFVIGATLAGFTLDFLRRFLLPALQLRRELADAIKALAELRDRAQSKPISPDEIDRVLGPVGLGHIWSEYSKTLHQQKEVDARGQLRSARWRSTALAETFFSDYAVVDARLNTDYFKHLPGLLTGLGIIGTFTGLIIGLQNYTKAESPGPDELRKLMIDIKMAFYISAAAIILAMICTAIEKGVVSARYRQASALRELIDSLYATGAGEEYLARLVAASETSATQAAQIKDALVADLKEILAAQTNMQIEAQSRQSERMSGDVGRAIVENLGAPIQAISQAVSGVSSNQGDAVNRILTDVLASFSGQMRDLFGGQLAGMSDLLRQTNDSMQATVRQFGQMATNIDAAGTGTVEAMGERMNRALDAVEARQQAMNSHMAAFVDQIRSLVAESQTESSKKLQEVLTTMGDQVAGVVTELRRQAETSAESQGERLQRFERSTGEVIGSLSSQMETLLARSMDTNRSLQGTVSQLTATTEKAMAELNAGAATLALAANNFAAAGKGVTQTLQESAKAVETIKSASDSLSVATNGTKAVLGDYAKTRDTFATMVSELRTTIEVAKREASMTAEVLKQLEAAAAQLTRAEKQSEEYLAGVNEVLVKAHESFAQNIERTLRESNRKFQAELSTAVSSLSGAVKDLGDVLDDLPTKRKG